MNLRQQIIQDRIEKTAQHLDISQDLAFLRFAHSLITGTSLHALDPADVTEGGQGKQIDVFSIDQDSEEATIYILQVKHTDSISSNALVLLRNGLKWVFNKPKSDVVALKNVPLKDRILEYRSIQSDLGPANIRVHVGFVTNAITADASGEVMQEAAALTDQFDNGTFQLFEFKVWGADELVTQLNLIEKHSRKIDADIPIRYDANTPSLIKYHASGLKGIVCTTTAKEMAKIVNADPSESVFDLNVRRFLGTKGAVNADIMKTCSDRSASHLFWFLNNGITIVCDSADPVTDPDKPHIKIKNLQIVNGCQTSKTLALADSQKKLVQDTRVLLRIYETQDVDLVRKMVLTTNNQNKISSRDLRANDPVQVDMERGFKRYGIHYERKLHQFDSMASTETSSIVPNEVVAQSYLAIVLKKPPTLVGENTKCGGNFMIRYSAGGSSSRTSSQ